jgi:U6 snRNA-associated Sm-like protein LSm2
VPHYSFFKTLTNQTVTIELKNDIRIRGILKSVDQYLNIKLDDIEVLDLAKYPHLSSVKNMFIRGSVVRYVMLPRSEVDVGLLEDATRRGELRIVPWAEFLGSISVLYSLKGSTKLATTITIRISTNRVIIQRLPTRLAKLGKRPWLPFYDKSRIALFNTVVPARWSSENKMRIWSKVWGSCDPNIEMTQLMTGGWVHVTKDVRKLPYHSTAPKIPNGHWIAAQ